MFLKLKSNKLTYIPKGLPKLKQLVKLIVSSNTITAIKSDDLIVSKSVTNLEIPPISFIISVNYVSGAVMNLNNNKDYI